MEKTICTTIPLKEVRFHDSHSDAWIVLFNHVYDITPFLSKHPAGSEILIEYAGRDGSLAFLEAGHHNVSLNSLQPYLLGVLPLAEHFNMKTSSFWSKRIKETFF